MKRPIALLLSCIFCFSLTFIAIADEIVAEETVLKTLEYEDIEDIMKLQNPTLISNNYIIEMLEDREVAETVQSALFTQFKAFTSLSSSLNHLMLDESNGDYLLATVTKTLLAIQTASIEEEMMALNKDTDSINDTKTQLDSVEKQLIYAAKSLFIAYNTLNLQIKDLEATLVSTEYSMEILAKRYELGQISQITYENAVISIPTIESAILSLDFQLDSIKSQLNLLLGYDYDYDLQIGSIPTVSAEYIDSIDYDADLLLSRESNLDIKTKSDDLEDAKDNKDKNYEVTLIALENATLLYDNQLKTHEYDFYLKYISITEKQRLLDFEAEKVALEIKNLEVAQTKYELGMISYETLVSAEDALRSKELAYASAEIEYFTAVEQYKLAVQGIIM